MYLILAFINLLSFAPVPCAKDPNDIAAVSKADGQHPAVYPAEAEIATLFGTVGQVLRNDAVRIGKGILCLCESDSMLLLILLSFLGVPLELSLSHRQRLT